MGFDYRREASGIVVVTMDMDGQSANTMSPAYHDLMGQTVARLEAEEGLVGVVIASAKKTFFAGGDLNGLMQAERGDDAYKAWLNTDKGYLRRLEKLPIPVVAAINGAALGGGFEICLSCNHRVILDSPAAIVGLPEVTLGLLPGAGGVARLPRMAALKQALDLLLSGRFVAPQEAVALGLVDQMVAHHDDLVPAAMDWIMSDKAEAQQLWDRSTVPAHDIDAARALVASTREDVLARTRGKMPAPLAILDIVEASFELSIDDTLLRETEEFAALLGRAETRASIWLNFFASNAIRSGKLRPAGDRLLSQSVAVLGDTPVAEAVAKAAAQKVDVQRDQARAGECDLVLGFGQAKTTFGAVCGVEKGANRPATQLGTNCFGFRIADWLPNSKVVEILVTDETPNHVQRRAYDFFQGIGRVPIVVRGEFLGLLFGAVVTEAGRLLEEGLTADEVAACAYDAGLTLSLPAMAAFEGAQPAPVTKHADAADRLLYVQTIAAIEALQAGRIRTEEEVDIASVQGLGFPPHTGGAIRFARGIGLEDFATRAAELAHRHGTQFDLSPDALTKLQTAATKAA